MTKKIPLGIVMTAFVLYIGMAAQGSAMAMTEDGLKDAVKETPLQTFGSSDSMMLVATSPTHKGGEATFMLVPRPAENVDGIALPTQAPADMILVAQSNGGQTSLVLVPKPMEGIDGIPLSKPAPIATNS